MYSIFVNGKEYSVVYRCSKKSLVQGWVRDLYHRFNADDIEVKMVYNRSKATA